MTDRERDAPRKDPDEDTDRFPSPPVSPEDAEAAAGADDLALAGDAFSADGYEEGYEEGDEDLGEEIGAEAVEETGEPTAATAAGAGRPRLRLGSRLGNRLGSGDSGAAAAALVTPSERAVRIDDRASQVFVVGVVATFVGILLFGMLGGVGGFFTTPASPSPSAELPSASVSPSAGASPGVSLEPSAASPSGSGASGAPNASPSPGVSPSPAGS